MVAYGTALVDDDPDRIGTVSALGLDETLFVRRGPWRRQLWCTSIVDVRAGRLLDIVRGVRLLALRNYRIRTLLYAGRPNWALLATITPR